MTSRETTLRAVAAWAGLLALVVFAPSAFPLTRRERAEATFQRALESQAKLIARPVDERTLSDYRVLILAFHEVYRLDPGYSKAPVALASIGDLYREMDHVFHRDSYAREAIKAYQFVIDQYPQTSMAVGAMISIADVYAEDLHQREPAQKAYEAFLKKHPRSARAAEVQVKLDKLDETIRAATAAAAAAPPAAKAPAPPPPAVVESVTTPQETASSGSLPQVTDIRNWVGPQYTRVVIGLSGEAKFDTLTLRNPDRIVVDLNGTRLSRALIGATYPVGSGFLKQVRAGQFRNNVTRVVLDVEKVQDYFVFTLPNPFRLVIDIHGPEPKAPAPTEVAKSAAPESKPAAGTPPAQVATRTNPPTLPPRAAEKPGTPTPKPSESRTATKATRAAGETPASATAEVPSGHPAAPTETGAQTLTRALGLKVARIVIDPGHGGHDTGTIGPTGLMEKDVVLDVALRLAKLLHERLGAEVILTRSTDVFIPLEERTAIANEKGADLFISIHANASHDESARGIETYYLNFTSDPHALEVAARENATSQESVHELRDLIKKIALTEKVEESHEFATRVQTAEYARLGRASGVQKNRGVKRAPFVVLIGANMPSILSEIAFLSNPRDERLLRKGDYRQKIAQALYDGTEKYVENLSGLKVASRVAAPAPAPGSD